MQVRSHPICICFNIKFYEDWVSKLNQKIFVPSIWHQNCLDNSLRNAPRNVQNSGETVQKITSRLLVKRTLEAWQELAIWIWRIYGKIVRSSTHSGCLTKFFSREIILELCKVKPNICHYMYLSTHLKSILGALLSRGWTVTIEHLVFELKKS